MRDPRRLVAARGEDGGLPLASIPRVKSLSSGDSITVFFVNNRALVREGLRALVGQQRDFVVVDGSETTSLGSEYRTTPDVVVVDVDLPDTHGPDALALLRKEFSESALLVLMRVDHPAKIQQVLKAGVDGLMLKSVFPSEFFFGIRVVAHGETYLQPSLGVELARWHRALLDTTVCVDQLTSKEMEVLRLLALGYTNSEIAELRSVSHRTIDAQRARIREKGGLRTRAQLVRYARELGVIDFDPT